jgi:hypothetical protein
MPIDPILQKPTLPEVPDARGPLMYDYTVKGNDVDVTEKELDHVDTPDTDK